jgi:hypothetical protein
MLVSNVSHHATYIDGRIQFWYFVPCGVYVCVASVQFLFEND